MPFEEFKKQVITGIKQKMEEAINSFDLLSESDFEDIELTDDAVEDQINIIIESIL